MVDDFHDIMVLAIEGSGTGIWDRDVVTGTIRYSSGWLEILGYSPGELPSRIDDSYDRVHPDDLAYVQAAMQDHFDARTSVYAAEYRLRCKDGHYKWVLSRGMVISRDARGRALRMVGTTTDITSTRLMAERLQQSTSLVANLTNQIPGLIFESRRTPDGMARMTYVSSGIREIFGLTAEDVATSTAPIHARIHPDDRAMYRASLDASQRDLVPWQCIFRVDLPARGVFWRQIDARPARLPDGETLWHGLVTDVTERMEMEQQLHDLARLDHLSGLPNRRAFLERMEKTWSGLVQARIDRVAVMMIDVDHFKSINDRYGHAAGDEVIRHVAAIMSSVLRSNDITGRMGGEEFAVCLPNIGSEEAGRIGDRLRCELAETQAWFEDVAISLTVSVGIARMLPTDRNGEQVLARADKALYMAKQAGRNRLSYAPDEG
ncbi:diguanylate cyclase domain-containing protein [Gluconacetobacter sacchari]|uniref:Diguanylate cyclase n=2 Tax=Gluconacetobacter sacchari TaxID=92759 RepID=A0A7W4IDA3_9PROT|nr:sensor domain-containing diguanylate cyclase [Gluconacetobacter sacchari]MBB2160765.1 diguanylate cyclase [Gluconacetobacter sacchari]GBQ29192.1 diguanylate cyclase [Gluconacetobacter sacchari DSM 12717]